MVTLTRYSDRYLALPGEGYDGVAQVVAGSRYGTGILLGDGRAVLTAAHVVQGTEAPVTVNLETVKGAVSLPTTRYAIHPAYDAVNTNHDLALVWLASPAPVAAERYSLYRDADEIGQTAALVGYGLPGSGPEGHVPSGSALPTRRTADNQLDATGEQLKAALGSGIGWRPAPDTQLIADFDDGSLAHDALGRLLGIHDTGLGDAEGAIAPGDSGGPAFIDGKVAGVASYTASLGGGLGPDVDGQANSSFGEIAAWQRVSHYQSWIDQRLREAYPQAPTRPEEVVTSVVEGDDGTDLVYFLLAFNGLRSDPQQTLSVDYATRDGSATAGEDYLAAADTLRLYPGEDQAIIAVEVLGDILPEGDETFFLDVFNPVGGRFAEDVVELTAVRTLIDDDGWLV